MPKLFPIPFCTATIFTSVKNTSEKRHQNPNVSQLSRLELLCDDFFGPTTNFKDIKDVQGREDQKTVLCLLCLFYLEIRVYLL